MLWYALLTKSWNDSYSNREVWGVLLPESCLWFFTCPYENFPLRSVILWAQKENNRNGHVCMSLPQLTWAQVYPKLACVLFSISNPNKALCAWKLVWFFFVCFFPASLFILIKDATFSYKVCFIKIFLKITAWLWTVILCYLPVGQSQYELVATWC